jgi:hypothetical protein
MMAKGGSKTVRKYRKSKKKMMAMMAPGESYQVQVDKKGKVKKAQIKDKSGEVVVEV